MNGDPPELAVLTNARAAGQRSMIGYGELVLEAARRAGRRVAEWRAVSSCQQGLAALDRRGRGDLGGRLDRFALSPLALAGRRASIAHVVDPGNAIYLDVVRTRRAAVTVHDMIPYRAEAGELDGFRPSRTGRALMRAIRARLARVDRVVCVSEATRRDLLRFSDVDPGRAVVVPNAIFQPLAPPSAADRRRLRRALNLPPDAAVVLHLGRNFYKNHAAVFDIFARLLRTRRPLVLVMVAPPSPERLAEVDRRGLSDHVRLLPYVAPADMAALYGVASVLLFPSLYEGFGYPVLEAQLCETPVVCSNAGALAEVAGAGAAVFDPADIAGMSEAVARILDDPDFAATLVARGRVNAARFDRERWFTAHDELWRALSGTADLQPPTADAA